ncbi:MAG: phosphoglycerate dehydrogenase [Puniceicoccales bacterium]|jgi:D-3-phosphoglycerate dehydrogenase|nr:phosphoglycerate dehydrogenase [Puniceicoccales bacterium]
MAKILLTTTSFQDTPGPHLEKLAASGHEVVRERGPLSEARMLELAAQGFDAFLCGDDAITAAVIERAAPPLRIIAKYGIGLDKIDVAAATAKKIPVAFTPGVNHTTVAEHAFGLLLTLVKQLDFHIAETRAGRWTRRTGHEIAGKTLGIVGLGRIGREMAIRAGAFGMNILAYEPFWTPDTAAFARKKTHKVKRVRSLDTLLGKCDVVTLHSNLTDETRGMIDRKRLRKMREGAILLNCGRGELVVTGDIVTALRRGDLGGYGADVLDEEPPPADHPLLTAPRCVITPHIGSRTYESVQRQAGMALENLLLLLDGKPALAQANKF